MAASFFFYDLETSGFDPRRARIMQFAGQRTDMNLKPIGEPINELIKMTPDVLPDAGAVLLTGITPQKTITDGLAEAEFLKLFYKEVAKPDTIFVGFNNIRFDDEFMRFLNYRNFYDAYEWAWLDGSSRWDILDIVRTARALKPQGIEWPFATDGRPTNSLGYLTSVNKLTHDAAHDALSDVHATIAVAKLVRDKQPKLFDYLLSVRKKDKVRGIVDSKKPFMYTSGRFPSKYLHTTASILLGRHTKQDYALVYDLRHDPDQFLDMSVDELIEIWKYNKDPDALRLPVKTLKYNRCPAIVPGIVQDTETLERLELSIDEITTNMAKLSKAGKSFVDKLFMAVEKMDQAREKAQTALVDNQLTVDARLYDGFIDGADKQTMRAVPAADPDELADFERRFKDSRLKNLLPLYKARNYPKKLSGEEIAEWEKFRYLQLVEGANESRLAKYFASLQDAANGKLSGEQKYLLEELKLYGESIIPESEAD
jgi:exodeoxyribonuclease I